MATKICSKCRNVKPLSAFNKDKSRISGYYYYCKSCHRARVNDFHNSWGSGIYKVVNKITDEFYVGQSNQLRRRKAEHFTKNKTAGVSSPLLDNNIKQYGKHNFDFIILKQCDVSELEQLEKQYIQELKPTLNTND